MSKDSVNMSTQEEDEDTDEKSDDEEDFADSEEDKAWSPESSSGSDSESFFEDSKTPNKIEKSKNKGANRRSSALRKITPPRVLSSSLREILEKAKPNAKPKLSLANLKDTPPTSGDESSSSGDEHLVDPNELKLDSTFFETRKSTVNDNEEERTKTPTFECNIGISKLSDSEEEEEEGDGKSRTSSSSNNKSTTDIPVSFDKLTKFTLDLNKAKENLSKFENQSDAANKTSVDVTQLLAIGEAANIQQKSKTPTKKKRRAAAADSDESDWEEVQEDAASVENVEGSSELKDVQVMLDLPMNRRAKKLQDEIETAIKRQMNKEKREQQVVLHKRGVKEWVSQGNHINGILNDASLFQVALKLLPSAHSYPKDKADQKYFEAIVKWYKSGPIKLSNLSPMYPALKYDLDIKESLREQMLSKVAIAKRDFILIFIVLLRAMGIQSRLVINLKVPPIRPPTSELCRIKVKDGEATVEPKTKKSAETKTKRSKKDEEILDDDSDKEEPKQAKRPSKAAKEGDTSIKKTKVETLSKEEKRPSTRKNTRSQKSNAKENENEKKKAILKDNGKTMTAEKLDEKIDDGKRKPRTKESTKSAKAGTLEKKKENIIATTSKGTNKSTKSEAASKTIPVNEARKSTRSTRSKKPLALDGDVIPQFDGMDELPGPSRITTRSKSKSPLPLGIIKKRLIEGQLFQKESPENPIKGKKSSTNNAKANTTLGLNEKVSVNVKNKEKAPGLFAVDPTEKRTVRGKKAAAAVTDLKRKASESDSPLVLKKSRKTQNIDRRLFSTDEEDEKAVGKEPADKKVDCWIEVWLEKEEKWVSIDLFKAKVDSIDTILRSATVPIAYAFAWANDGSLKDVSLRYCPQWHSVNKKMRSDSEWVEKILTPYKGNPTDRDEKEDKELEQLIHKRPMPTTISEFKNHPLYALKRHLLKFEAIYPPNALTLGFVRGEPIYARECVHSLHSREIWVKQARVVKPGEKPYKVVTARPKWERATNTVIKDLPLEIFGIWQTKEYEPPVAENGIVPKNAYGNVELFKECMLPINTVHLPYPGLNRVCKKLKVDCAPAVVGFDFHGGYSHPVYEGFVVCKEFAELVTDTWIKDTEEAEKREVEKYQERVFGNWKRLIKGLLIKRRLQLKYNFQE